MFTQVFLQRRRFIFERFFCDQTVNCFFVISAIVILAGSVQSLVADEPQEEGFTLLKEGTRPLVSVTFAGADRLLSEAEYIFDAAEQPEGFAAISDRVNGLLDQIDSFDRSKPAGFMVYLPALIPPIPEVYMYVPISDFQDVSKFVELVLERAPVVGAKQAEEGRYEVIGPRRTWYVLMQGNYAFIPMGGNATPESLDRELPDPSALVGNQARQYDIALTLDIASIPATTRMILTNVLTAGISSQMQQRDEEPDGAYRIRKAEGDRALAALRQLLDECDRIMVGLDVVQEERAVNLDMVIDAIAGTKLFDEIFESTTKPSYFIPLLDDSAAASFSMSSLINDRDKNAYIEMLDGLKTEIVRQIEVNKLGPVPDENGAIGQALTALQTTLDNAHLDAFAQFYADSDDKLAIVGAMRLLDGEAVAAGMQDVFSRLQDVGDFKENVDLKIGYGQHQGITFHRLAPKQVPAEFTELFGKSPGLTIGVGERTIWLAAGGELSFDTLQGVMDQLQNALENPQERTTPANFRMIVNMNQLVEMQQRVAGSMQKEQFSEIEASLAEPTPDANPQANSPAETGERTEGRRQRGANSARQAQRREMAGRIFRETMAEGDDRIEIDFRPTETGGRMRMRLEEGFVKIFGRLVANAVSPAE